MARCEDYPCCGHDICPDYDDCGNQLNMKCVCGATVPLNNRSSLCDACLNADDDRFENEFESEPKMFDDEEMEEEYSDMLDNLMEGDYESQ